MSKKKPFRRRRATPEQVKATKKLLASVQALEPQNGPRSVSLAELAGPALSIVMKNLLERFIPHTPELLGTMQNAETAVVLRLLGHVRSNIERVHALAVSDEPRRLDKIAALAHEILEVLPPASLPLPAAMSARSAASTGFVTLLTP